MCIFFYYDLAKEMVIISIWIALRIQNKNKTSSNEWIIHENHLKVIWTVDFYLIEVKKKQTKIKTNKILMRAHPLLLVVHHHHQPGSH